MPSGITFLEDSNWYSLYTWGKISRVKWIRDRQDPPTAFGPETIVIEGKNITSPHNGGYVF